MAMVEEHEVFQPETIGKWSFFLRYFVSHPLATKEVKLDFALDGRLVRIKAFRNKTLENETDLVAEVHGFDDEETAREYAKTLKIALSVAALERSMGANFGENNSTSNIGQELKDTLEQQGGTYVPNTHGIYVFLRTGSEFRLKFNVEIAVSEPTHLYVENLEHSWEKSRGVDDVMASALEILALAGMSREPLARAALAISVVEMLAKSKPWSDEQISLIDELVDRASNSSGLASEDATEVANSIKNLYKSIRQSIKRYILNDIGLPTDDWKNFDKLYSLRSAVFHGGALPRKQILIQLGDDAYSVCRTIVLAAAISKATKSNEH
ncbi:hypothetical protein QWE_15197 [Agrobacterium albertimagni AOL15]|uniref:Apea-like HEPN domain-containing protein n=1 Tax=Agrobacterium albertimagni AOL15 TaxID=1156935 RepID=K2Q5B8_9HYPH|nr:hypothetical protein [Agrobacterium albertimagni]EKF58924.1 hypothetical protein QWE_15197 [Agrobacterium albertimagni AOL15]